MIRTIRVKLRPSKEQEELMFKSANVMRFAHNWGLNFQMNYYQRYGKNISYGNLGKIFTKLRNTKGYEWLKEVSSDTPQRAIKKDLKSAYDNFFEIQQKSKGFSKAKIRKAKLKNKTLSTYDLKGHPKFKSKNYADISFYMLNNKIITTKTTVQLEKIGKVEYSGNKLPIRKNKKSKVKFSNPRIKYEGSSWYLTTGVEYQKDTSIKLNNTSIGVDLGIKDLAVVSNIDKPFKNINKSKRVSRLKKKLRRKQKQLSRKYQMNNNEGQYKKTKNIIKLESKIKRIHKKLADIRKDYLHKVTNTIAKTKPSRIVLEDLNVSGMMKNKHLSEKIQEQGFNIFANFMIYKAENLGIKLIKADRFYPSSKKCSLCGFIKQDLKLSDRVYKCKSCGLIIDRDQNASINLANYDLA